MESLQEDALEVARQLVAIAAKKPFMSEICTVAVGNLVKGCRCHDDGEDVRLEIVRGEGGMCEGWRGCTPERLYLFLRLNELLKGELWWKKIAEEKWKEGGEGVISADSFASLIPILEVS